jgi:hypothetical protein
LGVRGCGLGRIRVALAVFFHTIKKSMAEVFEVLLEKPQNAICLD